MHTAILGWGSLIWESRPDFDDQHHAWESDGPELPLEFSRVSTTRRGALTLVLDRVSGKTCRVAHARSTRVNPADAIRDLVRREGTLSQHIGYVYADGSRSHGRESCLIETIRAWAQARQVEVAIWTDLPINFQEISKVEFSVDAAVQYVSSLPPDGFVRAAEYVWNAPEFVQTPLRRALQRQPWFLRPS